MKASPGTTWSLFAAVIWSVMALVAPLPSAGQANMTKVTAGVVLESSPTGWLYRVAQQQGYFRAEGLEVSTVSTYEQIAAVIGGSLNIGEYDPATTLIAQAKGANIVTVAALYEKAPFFIFAKAGTRDVKDLQGLQFAVSGVPSGDWAIVQTFLRRKGIQVNYRKLGGTPARLAALQAGQVDATIIALPFHLKAMAGGLKAVVTPDELTYPWLNIFVRKDWAKDHPAAVAGYLRAVRKAMEWSEVPANKSAFVKVIMDLAKVDEKTALDSYDWVVTKRLHRLQALSLQEAQELVSALQLEGAVPKGYDPKEAIDAKYAEQAKR